jgi:hypothetical protein
LIDLVRGADRQVCLRLIPLGSWDGNALPVEQYPDLLLWLRIFRQRCIGDEELKVGR